MTRIGKIARLPLAVREELNRRLQEGESGIRLIAWLNERDEVRAVLAAHFGGRPLNEQNLSEWKQGGFGDWLRHQEARAWMRRLAEESADLEQDAGLADVADRLSGPLAIVLGRCARQLALGALHDGEQRKALLATVRELNQLRRGDHAARRFRLEREPREAQQAKESEKKRQAEEHAARMKRDYPELFDHRPIFSRDPIPPEFRAIAQEIAKKRSVASGAGSVISSSDQSGSR